MHFTHLKCKSQGCGMFTELCGHHHRRFSTISSPPEPCTCYQSPTPLALPQPLKPGVSLLCLPAPDGSHKWVPRCWSFVTALTASCPGAHLPGGGVSALFLFMAKSYSTVCLSIPQPCTPGSFQFLASVGTSACIPAQRESAHSQPLPQVVPAGQPPTPTRSIPGDLL